jgi:hypothetical protein
MKRLSDSDIAYRCLLWDGRRSGDLYKEIRLLRAVEKAARAFHPCLSHKEPQGPLGLCVRCDLAAAILALPEVSP